MFRQNKKHELPLQQQHLQLSRIGSSYLKGKRKILNFTIHLTKEKLKYERVFFALEKRKKIEKRNFTSPTPDYKLTRPDFNFFCFGLLPKLTFFFLVRLSPSHTHSIYLIFLKSCETHILKFYFVTKLFFSILPGFTSHTRATAVQGHMSNLTFNFTVETYPWMSNLSWQIIREY